MTEKHQNLYLEFSEPVERQAVNEALARAGLTVSDSRAVTKNNDGYIITNLLAKGIWNHESDSTNCAGPCPETKKHLEWEELSPDQQQTFMSSFAQFLTKYTSEELMLNLLLEDEDDFEGVALDKHQE